jgi:CRISPR system Cascade subunit CasC
MTTLPKIHISIIQTLPLANINRGETGDPKSLTFGGTDRTYVSSQSWKRATRLAFDAVLSDNSLRSIRSRRYIHRATEILTESHGWNTEDAKVVTSWIHNTIAGGDEGKAMLLLRADAAEILADTVADMSEDVYGPAVKLHQARAAKENQDKDATAAEKKKASKLVSDLETEAAALGKLLIKNGVIDDLVMSEHNPSIAMNGRMIASNKHLGVDAAVNVAHAFAVHATKPVVDFFVAIDDLNTDDTAVAGMMGNRVLTADTLYRNATINLEQLKANLTAEDTKPKLPDLAAIAVDWLNAFVLSMPTGMITSTNPTTPPVAVMVQITDWSLGNLASAFAKPVHPSEQGGDINAAATARLVDYFQGAYAGYGGRTGHTVGHFDRAPIGLDSTMIETVDSHTELLDSVRNAILNHRGASQ